MSKVIFSATGSYAYERLRRDIFSMLDELGGGEIRKGSLVLIKPNLLGPAGPEAAMVTHPHVVRAAVDYVLEKEAVPQVSDSPAIGFFEKVIEASGIRDALRGRDVIIKEFKESESVRVGDPFKRIEIASDALRAPFIINLPKLKSHTQMLLTVAVKNTYGCIVGLRKPEWHFRTGANRDLFAKLLVQTCLVVRPTVSIVDGILAMEGQGPGRGGVPRHIGVLIGSRDPVALDMAVCRMLRIDPFSLPTNLAARGLGLVDSRLDIEGDMPLVPDFRFPDLAPLVFGPRPLHGLMRRHLVQRPVCIDEKCRRCGECWRYCPAKAIAPGDKRLSFDYEKCIRCYCCVEVCPHGALRAEEPLIGRAIKKIVERTRR